jgi:hypothetical protein
VNPATADRLVQFAAVPMLLGIACWLGGLKISAMMLVGIGAMAASLSNWRTERGLWMLAGLFLVMYGGIYLSLLILSIQQVIAGRAGQGVLAFDVVIGTCSLGVAVRTFWAMTCWNFHMPREYKINALIRDQWRELGIYYERNDALQEWWLIGCRAGLLAFTRQLTNYTDDPRNELPSEHEHFGPYGYLKVMTWPTPGIDADSIHGSVGDLRRLTAIIAENVKTMRTGEILKIRTQYAPDAEYTIVLDLRPDDFDPASLDTGWQRL